MVGPAARPSQKTVADSRRYSDTLSRIVSKTGEHYLDADGLFPGGGAQTSNKVLRSSAGEWIIIGILWSIVARKLTLVSEMMFNR